MAKLKEVKKNQIKLIKKSNDLIEARYMFDIWETRFFLSILSQIHKDDKDLHIYRVRFKDVIKTFGLKSNSSYELLRNAAKSMMNRKVAVSYEKDGVNREMLYHIVRKVDYLKEGEVRRGDEIHEYIDVMIEDEMKPFLLELQKNFTAYDLRHVTKLGVYPIRIYELLKQYESIGRRILEVSEIKKMFELTHEYPKFGNFFQKIIQPAIKEINLHTDLKILDVIKIKEDRNVVSLQFVFCRKTANELAMVGKPNAAPSENTMDLFSNMNDRVGEEFANYENVVEENEADKLFAFYHENIVAKFGVTPTIFLRALENKTEKDIEKAIRVTELAQSKGDLKNTAGFFIEALRQGFTNDKEEKKMKAQKVVLDKKQQEAALKTERDTQKQAINDKIRELTAADPTLTDRAIEQVKQSKAGQFRLRVLGITDPNPDIDLFRKDEQLRDFVKMAILGEL
jgi:plasmid replication initiation protein